jgi:hypothetical protein
LIWQFANQWPSLEYWTNYGTGRMVQADLPQYLMNLLTYMYSLLLPLWLVGLYRIFRPLDGRNYSFLGIMFLATFGLMFVLHSPARMLVALLMPILAAGAVFFEELVSGRRWEMGMKISAAAYVFAIGVLAALFVLPILPPDRLPVYIDRFKILNHTIREFRGVYWRYPPTLSGRLGWDGLVQDVAAVYDALPAEDRAIAGIYTDWYMSAGAIDMLGPQYGLPHAVSGSLTYYLWGPGYSWEVMILVGGRTNDAGVFFEECELKHIAEHDLSQPVEEPYIYVCRKPKVPADVIWGGMKNYR